NRPNANSGRAELELARIRHARRRVALLRVVQAPTHSPDARDQCPRLRGLSARRRASACRRLGIHGPLLRAGADPWRAGSKGDGRALACDPRALLRQASARLAWARADGNARYAGSPRRRWREIYRRLGL